MAFDQHSTPTLAPPPTDPTGPHIAASCFELLQIELVPLAYRLAAAAADREASAATTATTTTTLTTTLVSRSRAKAKSVDTATGSATTSSVVAVGAAAGGGAAAPLKGVGVVAGAGGVDVEGHALGIGGIGGAVKGLDDEETRESVFWRLDSLGYRVGLGIVDRFSRDKPRFTDTLDVIKFLCKDLWILVFKKQIDNLKTNHRGVYVLTDNSFKPLSKISLERGRDGMMAQAQPFLYFPAGLIRGALASMGVVATVQAESIELPGATFQIRTMGVRS